MCVWVYACKCACPQGPEVLSLLALGLQMVVSCLKWVLGTELKSSERAGHTSNSHAIFPVPLLVFLRQDLTPWPRLYMACNPHDSVSGVLGLQVCTVILFDIAY